MNGETILARAASCSGQSKALAIAALGTVLGAALLATAAAVQVVTLPPSGDTRSRP